jgi:hypothetical protein
LVRKSTAPALIARTVEGMSPWPVMKTIGGRLPARTGLQVEAVDVRKLHVEHEAAGTSGFGMARYSPRNGR